MKLTETQGNKPSQLPIARAPHTTRNQVARFTGEHSAGYVLPFTFHVSCFTFGILLTLCIIFFGCQSADEKTQRKEELKREATKLKIGLTLTPEDALGHLQLGEIYHQMGEHDRAIEEFRMALRIDAENPQIHNNLGLIYVDLQSMAAAIDAFQQAIELEPDNATFYNNLGYVYDTADEFGRAIEAYRRAIELDPEFQDAYYNLASVYHTRELFEEAITYYQRALESDPNDADAPLQSWRGLQRNGTI